MHHPAQEAERRKKGIEGVILPNLRSVTKIKTGLRQDQDRTKI